MQRRDSDLTISEAFLQRADEVIERSEPAGVWLTTPEQPAKIAASMRTMSPHNFMVSPPTRRCSILENALSECPLSARSGSQQAALFDYLIGKGGKPVRNLQLHGLCCRAIYDEFEPRRLHDRP
jgi:hypothetical protein